MENIKKMLIENYNLGKIHDIQNQQGGYLNKNFAIRTFNAVESNFFLQQVSGHSRKNISGEIAVLEFLKQSGFPCSTIIKNKYGLYLTSDGISSYLLSNFIDGHSPKKFNNISKPQLLEAATVLAKFHKVIQEFSAAKVSNPNTPSKEKAIDICNKVRKIINHKKKFDSFDRQVSLIIDKKILILNDPQFEFPKLLSSCPQIFCHGDYHGANLIFNANDTIIGVVDWEFFGYDYRIWEVARSMSFICDINYTGSMVGPVDFEKAAFYLKAYITENMLTKEELKVIVQLLQYKAICCCFTLEKHYLESNSDISVFYPQKATDWFWWLDHGAEFEEKVIAKLNAQLFAGYTL